MIFDILNFLLAFDHYSGTILSNLAQLGDHLILMLQFAAQLRILLLNFAKLSGTFLALDDELVNAPSQLFMLLVFSCKLVLQRKYFIMLLNSLVLLLLQALNSEKFRLFLQ